MWEPGTCCLRTGLQQGQMESSSQSLLPLPGHHSWERAGALGLYLNLDHVQPHCQLPTSRVRQPPPCSVSLSCRLQPARSQSDAVSKQRTSSSPAVTGEAFLRNLFSLRLLFKPLCLVCITLQLIAFPRMLLRSLEEEDKQGGEM